MRSSILSLAVLAASALAAPAPAVDCTTKGNTVIEYYDVTVTEVVYVTEGAAPASTAAAYTTKRRKHHHSSKKPSSSIYYAPAPTEDVVTVTYGYEAPASTPPPVYTPEPVYSPAPSPAPSVVQAAPAPSGEKPSSTGDLATDVVALHNYYRAKFGVPDLTWDSTLASYAETNTGNCIMAHTGGPYGENLAFGYSDAMAGIDGWYGEYNQYDFANGGFGKDTGHFTQLIWKGTSTIGCYVRDCNGSGYLMCEYSSPGNVIGYFQDNCPSLLSGQSY